MVLVTLRILWASCRQEVDLTFPGALIRQVRILVNARRETAEPLRLLVKMGWYSDRVLEWPVHGTVFHIEVKDAQEIREGFDSTQQTILSCIDPAIKSRMFNEVQTFNGVQPQTPVCSRISVGKSGIGSIKSTYGRAASYCTLATSEHTLCLRGAVIDPHLSHFGATAYATFRWV